LIKKEEYIVATINRNDVSVFDGIDAKVEVITNEYGCIEFFHIKNHGTKYNEKTTIDIYDKDTGTSYSIDSADFIEIGSNGEILSISLPSKQAGFCYPSITYSGEIFFPRVSVGLIETAQLYILEEISSNDETVYSSPRSYTDSLNYTSTTINIGNSTGCDHALTDWNTYLCKDLKLVGSVNLRRLDERHWYSSHILRDQVHTKR
jgi:hypothetical protein